MLDLVIIVIILITALIAAKVGLIRTLYQVFSSILALVLAFFVYPIIETILKLTPLYTTIQEGVKNLLPEMGNVGLQAQAQLIRENFKWMPEFMTNQLIENNNPEIYNLLGVSTLVEYIVTFVANTCMMAIAVVICFIVIKVGLTLAVGVLDLVAKLPILKTANTWGGFIVGIIKGMLIIWIICLVIPFLIMIPQFAGLEMLVEESYLMTLFYNHNILLEALVNLKL
ncbi:MAG: CvpA family protein [Niameybacter sp.]|uniref:CvpA family protein n=1 Tax=Niameybacter sp. TaxID=2033640 RepID=UPI002FCB51D8